MKVGDLVRYTPDGIVSDAWKEWYGIVVKVIPGTAEIRVVRWNKDNSVSTSTQKSDLRIVSASRV